jgi:hypothetical protein
MQSTICDTQSPFGAALNEGSQRFYRQNGTIQCRNSVLWCVRKLDKTGLLSIFARRDVAADRCVTGANLDHVTAELVRPLRTSANAAVCVDRRMSAIPNGGVPFPSSESPRMPSACQRDGRDLSREMVCAGPRLGPPATQAVRHSAIAQILGLLLGWWPPPFTHAHRNLIV